MNRNRSVLPCLIPCAFLRFVERVVTWGGQRVLLLRMGRLLDLADLLLNRAHTLLYEGHLFAHRSCLVRLQIGSHEDTRFLSDLLQVFMGDDLSLDKAVFASVVQVVIGEVIGGVRI